MQLACKITKKVDSLETYPSAGLTQQSMTLQVGWHQGLTSKPVKSWHQNLTQNTLKHTCADTCSANREISSSEQVGFCNHCNTLWAVNVSAKTAKQVNKETHIIHWVNKVNKGAHNTTMCCVICVHSHPMVSRLITTPLFQQGSHCQSVEQYIVKPFKLTLCLL